MRLDKEEVKSSDTDNMYDFFTKKTIDRFLDKKHIERLDKDYIDWNKKIDLPDYVKNNPNIDYWNISGPHTEFNKKFIIPIGKKKNNKYGSRNSLFTLYHARTYSRIFKRI